MGGCFGHNRLVRPAAATIEPQLGHSAKVGLAVQLFQTVAMTFCEIGDRGQFEQELRACTIIESERRSSISPDTVA